MEGQKEGFNDLGCVLLKHILSIFMLREVKKKFIDLEKRLELASIKGLIRLPLKDEKVPPFKKIALTGKSLTEIILDEREKEW